MSNSRLPGVSDDKKRLVWLDVMIRSLASGRKGPPLCNMRQRITLSDQWKRRYRNHLGRSYAEDPTVCVDSICLRCFGGLECVYLPGSP
jgi:hypothetical protein